MAALDYVPVVQQLYISYFGRPADTFGLKNFTEQLDALGAPKTFVELNAAAQADKAGTSALSKLVNSFGASEESKNLYGTDNSNLGISKFLVSVFQNVLGVTPELGEGWDFWFNAIASGSLRRADAAMAITEGAITNTSTQGLVNAKTVANKLAVSTAFTAALDSPEKINAYTGAAAVDAASGLLKNVTSATDVAAYQATVLATVATVVSGSIPGVTKDLTTSVDTVVGGNGNDSFTAILSATAAEVTLNALDSADGGAGTDTLTILDKNAAGSAIPGGLTIKNIENIVLRGAGVVSFDQTVQAGITGVTKVAVTQATDATVTAAAGVAIEVTGASGDVVATGGSTQTVSIAGGTGDDVTVSGAAGAITVTDKAQADGVLTIDGGTSVVVTATGVTTGSVAIGGTTAPTGTVTVTSSGAAAGGAAAVVLGAIGVTGGTVVTVSQTATSDAAKAAEDTAATTNSITQSAVTVTGSTKTTEVSVAQTAASAGEDAVVAVAGVKTVDVVTFVGMDATETVTIDGLVFTAAKTLTAAEVAAAFAGLTAGATQGNAPAANGIYSGALSANFTSGAVVTSGTAKSVTFTAAEADATVASISIADTTAVGSVSKAGAVAGVTEVEAVTGELAVVGGAVVIASASDKITTVTLDGFGASSTIDSDALATLKLAHSNEDLAITNGVATTLALTVDGVGKSTNTAAIALGGTYTTLNIVTANVKSDIDLTGDGAVTALNVSGTQVVDLNASAFAALKTVVVTGSAGVKVVASAATVTSVDTSGTTGDSSVTIDATKATFTGGAGADTVTTTAAAPTKAISLGAGDDVLNLVATASTGLLSGGEGTDTLGLASADAAIASGSSTLNGFIDSFEKLSLGLTAAAATDTVDLANLDGISYVTTAGVGAGGTLNIDHMAANGTLIVKGNSVLIDVDGTLVSGTADVLNVTLTGDGITGGTLDTAGIETINLTATDETAVGGIQVDTVTLKDAALKSVVATGNSHLTVTLDANVVALTSLDGSALTGKLVASTNGTVAQTIKGGTAADTLTATGTNDVLLGGAGNDVLAGKNLTTLTGGAGNDTFDVSANTTNVNSYSTITDLTAGDSIKFAGATDFLASKVALADTAVFQDYANAAINATDTGDVSWFQISGNTYVIENVGNGASFANGTDHIVKITGLVDLSTASLNSDIFTLIVH